MSGAAANESSVLACAIGMRLAAAAAATGRAGYDACMHSMVNCLQWARLSNVFWGRAAGVKVAGAMLSAGVLPALEQLFRQLPVVSPAHVTAATFLVSQA